MNKILVSKNHPFINMFDDFMLEWEYRGHGFEFEKKKSWNAPNCVLEVWNRKMKKKWLAEKIQEIQYYNKCKLIVHLTFPELVIHTIGFFLGKSPPRSPVLRRFLPFKCGVCKDYLGSLSGLCYSCGCAIVFEKKSLSCM